MTITMASRGGCTTAQQASRAGEPPDVTGWRLHDHLAFLALPSAVPCARLHTRHVLREWGVGVASREVIELAVSELVTNAVAAAAEAGSPLPVHFWLISDGMRVLICVQDPSPCRPVRLAPDGETESGRGLMLVEAVAMTWGSWAAPAGKVVWAVCNGQGES
jgi:anti-sigma regulatory factor (Ser/Thr protein kinase)